MDTLRPYWFRRLLGFKSPKTDGTMRNAYKDDTIPCKAPLYCGCKICKSRDLNQG